MTDRSIDKLEPVDYLIVEFPAGEQNFTGEGADELLRLQRRRASSASWTSAHLLQKGDRRGPSSRRSWAISMRSGELRTLRGLSLPQTLAEVDVDHLGRRDGIPGSVACACSCMRRSRHAPVRLGHAPGRRPAHRERADPEPGHHRRRRRPTRRSQLRESEMPLRPGRRRSGRHRRPCRQGSRRR